MVKIKRLGGQITKKVYKSLLELEIQRA